MASVRSWKRKMATTSKCKKILSFYVPVTIISLVFPLILIHEHVNKKEEKAETHANFVSYFKLVRNHEHTISKNAMIKIKPEDQLNELCMHVDTLDRLKMTSLKFSKITMVKLDEKGNITLNIKTFDMRNKSKSFGDDVIVVWASQVERNGSVAGHVTDHLNGSYTANIKVHWIGKTKLTVKLASSIENTCLRMKALRKYGNSVFATVKPWGIKGTFRKGRTGELTPCGTSRIIFENRKVCNFTRLNGGMAWFCGKPKRARLKCLDIKSFGTGSFYYSKVPQYERIQNSGHGIFEQILSLDINVFHKERREISCSHHPVLSSWTDPVPSGYWFDNKWNFVNCYTNIKHNVHLYAQCLKNKYVVFIGDSTVRQYAEYFIEHVLDLGHVNMDIWSNGEYHAKKLFENYGIKLTYIKHEMPFQNKKLSSKGIISVPQILHSFEDLNDSLILIIHYNSHFSAYPPSNFRERIRHLTTAIESFLIVKPNAKIFFKGPHVCIDDIRWFDAKISLLFEEIIREEFSKLRNNVIYLDVWSITVTHNSENLHPAGNAFNSQIHQLMSYIC